MKTYTSVDKLVSRLEAQGIKQQMAEVRAPKLSIAEIAIGLKELIKSKIWQLKKLQSPADISKRRHELAVLVQAYDVVLGRGAYAAGPPT